MKKNKLLIIITIIIPTSVSGQTHLKKSALDTGVFNKWPRIIYASSALSNDGKYMFYPIMNRSNNNETLVLQSLGKWQMEVAEAHNASFTADSRKVIFKKGLDSLCIQDLKNRKAKYITEVNTFKLFKQGADEWLIYQLTTKGKPLLLANLRSGIVSRFDDVSNYLLSKGGNSLLVTRNVIEKNVQLTSVSLVSVQSGKELLIWKGEYPSSFIFDNSGKRLVFSAKNSEDTAKEKRRLLWFYQQGDANASLILNDKLLGLDSGLRFSAIDHFSEDGERLFFKAREPALPKALSAAVMVDIWSYLDTKLQSQQLAELKANTTEKEYLHVLSVHENKLIRLQQENEEVTILEGKQEEIAFVIEYQVDSDQLEPWNRFAVPSNHLVFTKSGKRVDIGFKLATSNPRILSPDGNFLLLMDEKEKDLYSYELSSGVIRNLTKTLPVPLNYDKRSKEDHYHESRLLKVAAWMKNDENFLLYDEFDIWKLDPRGKIDAVCITNNYGRIHKTDFKLIDDQDGYKDNIQLIDSSVSLILSAFDRVKKLNGFYSLKMGKKQILEELSMSPNIYFVDTWDVSGGLRPIKLPGKNKWLVTKESASSSPNFYYTTDFKSFHPISDLHPEKDYNWLTSKVVSFKTINGEIEQGVLYKPEDFDSTRKYPVIIHYYEQLSDEANFFKHPFPISHGIEIPWFVSNDYLVFTPDIHYTFGHTGENALNSVEGAAKYLKNFSWIDSSGIGIQGHSFGGYETNYIITHSNTFAAAMSSAGESDFISAYNSLAGGALNGTRSFQSFHELAQCRLGGSLWDNPAVYINNSPIFEASHVTTPLLMMNNKKDGAVDFSQGVEFFTALRRLGKRVWMLQYDNGSHALIDDNDALQHTIRMTQFFDHYLKRTAAGEWMLKGIPAKHKGIDSGLRLSAEVNGDGKPATPGAGLLTAEEQRKVEALQQRKPVTVTIK